MSRVPQVIGNQFPAAPNQIRQIVRKVIPDSKEQLLLESLLQAGSDESERPGGG